MGLEFLPSKLQGCQYMVTQLASRRDFSFFSLVARPLGLSCGLSPTSACGPTIGVVLAPRLPWSTEFCPSEYRAWRWQAASLILSTSFPSCRFPPSHPLRLSPHTQQQPSPQVSSSIPTFWHPALMHASRHTHPRLEHERAGRWHGLPV